MTDQPQGDESQDNVGTGAEISTENEAPAIFSAGSDGVPQSGAPQREIYQSELAQSQEDIARLTRTIIRGCDEYGSREHREYGEEANNDNYAAPAEAQAEAQAAKQAVAPQRLRYRCLLYTSPSPRDKHRSRIPS